MRRPVNVRSKRSITATLTLSIVTTLPVAALSPAARASSSPRISPLTTLLSSLTLANFPMARRSFSLRTVHLGRQPPREDIFSFEIIQIGVRFLVHLESSGRSSNFAKFKYRRRTTLTFLHLIRLMSFERKTNRSDTAKVVYGQKENRLQ